MKRTLVLGALLAAGLLSVAVAAQQAPPPTANDVMVEKVRDNLYVLRGGLGGNTAAFVTANGVVLVDTKLPGWGQPLLDTLNRLTPKPVTTVINTHWHFDHVSGNVEMPANVEFVTHENTKTSMEQQNPVYQNFFKQHNGHGMPTTTFRDTMTLGSGTDRIELRYFGRAHTGGDAFVIFPALRIAHVGDVFPNKGLPNIDTDNGGSGVAYADTIDRAAKGLAGMTAIINGHADAQTPPICASTAPSSATSPPRSGPPGNPARASTSSSRSGRRRRSTRTIWPPTRRPVCRTSRKRTSRAMLNSA